MFAEERKNKIIDIVNKQGKIIVPELCDIFGVSASTIRNDLKELEHDNLLKRTHGGAISQSKVRREPLPKASEVRRVKQKEQIAVAANSLVEDGDVIAISSGTTIFEFVKTLTSKKNLTILVNNIQMAAWLEEHTDFTIVLLGGILRNNYHYVVSPIKSELLNLMNIDKTFLSVNGVHEDKGITTSDIETAMNYKRITESSVKTYILCDSSKVGTVTFAKIMDVSETSAIITDTGISQSDKEALSAITDVIVVGEDKEADDVTYNSQEF